MPSSAAGLALTISLRALTRKRDLLFHGFVEQVGNLLHRGFAHAFAAIFEGCVDMDGDILHFGVSFRGTSHKHYVVAASDAVVAIVVVQADAEEAYHFRLGPGFLRHRCPLSLHQLYAPQSSLVNRKLCMK
jgi:hypothetical protein